MTVGEAISPGIAYAKRLVGIISLGDLAAQGDETRTPGPVTPRAVLGDDALEVLPAHLHKQVAAYPVDVLGVEDRTQPWGRPRAGASFARPAVAPSRLAVHDQHVESD